MSYLKLRTHVVLLSADARRPSIEPTVKPKTLIRAGTCHLWLDRFTARFTAASWGCVRLPRAKSSGATFHEDTTALQQLHFDATNPRTTGAWNLTDRDAVDELVNIFEINEDRPAADLDDISGSRTF